MPGAANSIAFTGPRRIRVLCTQALGAAAFTTLGVYTVTSVDNLGGTPTVLAAYAISGASQLVELAVDTDLTGGGLYQVAFASLPFADSSTFTGNLQARVPSAVNTPNPQADPSTGDFDLLFYGRDLLQTDEGDYALDATGDLATTAGRPNWQGALLRGAMSDGVPWDAAYAAKPGQYVNAPTQYQLPLSARIVQSARYDNRTKTAQVQLVPNPNGLPGAFVFQLSATGRDGLDKPVTFLVPTSKS